MLLIQQVNKGRFEMNCYCRFWYETHRLEGYQPTPAALLSTCVQPWDVENSVVLNKCLLNSQGMETKTSG